MLLKKSCGSPESFPAHSKRDHQHWVSIWAKGRLRPMQIKSQLTLVSQTIFLVTQGDIRLVHTPLL